MSINGLLTLKLKRVGCCRYKPENLKFSYETALLSEVLSPKVTLKIPHLFTNIVLPITSSCVVNSKNQPTFRNLLVA